MKKGILLVSFGTSHLDALEKNIEAIEKQTRDTFPEYKVYRAFTSGMIMKKLRTLMNINIPNVEEALKQMLSDGIEQIVVQPTHIIHGMEYDKMISDVMKYKEKFREVRRGTPLLNTTEDYKKAIHAVVEAVKPSEDDVLVLMGHGSEHHANAAYPALEYTFHRLGYHQVVIGTVEGFPGLPDVLARLETGDRKKVILMPFMVVAGDHAKNDMAGEEGSWKTELEAAGYQVTAVVKGLGEIEKIREIYMEHIKEAM